MDEPRASEIESDPGGTVRIRGRFAENSRDEILRLVRDIEAREQQLHPSHRTLEIAEDGPDLVLRTSGRHLAQAIGHGLEGAFKGRLVLDFEQDLVRILWERHA